VARHLADQLILPLALAGEGAFTTLAPSRHARTNIDVIGLFLDVPLQLEDLGHGRWQIRIGEARSEP
jgi:RNA 3'-terminal phosphate cyclase (ATP)